MRKMTFRFDQCSALIIPRNMEYIAINGFGRSVRRMRRVLDVKDGRIESRQELSFTL